MAAAGTFWGLTAAFVLLEVILFFGITITGKKGENGLKQLFAATTVICAWSMWALIYIAQIHPLVSPQLSLGE